MAASVGTRRRLLGIAGGFLALVAVLAASLAIGSEHVALGDVWSSFTAYDPDYRPHLIVRTSRLERTGAGLVVGASLGAAGAVMQGVTRNPLADSAILGVDAGAGLAIVVAISAFGVATIDGFLWFAFGGAALTAVVVYVLGSIGRSGATPVKLTLAGAAVTILVASITELLLLLDRSLTRRYRLWSGGSLAAADTQVLLTVAPFVVAGLLLAVASVAALNALALGDDVATALGHRVGRARLVAALAIVMLCGSAVAVAGPIGFIGLMVPHAARLLAGPDYRWIVPYSIVLGPALLLGADVIGRIVARPTEIQAGLVTAMIGGAVFVALARRRRLVEL